MLFFEDTKINYDFYYSKFTVLLKILFGWTARLSAFQSGVIVRAKDAVQTMEAATITDAVAMSETRSVSTSAFNTIWVNAWTPTTTTWLQVSDAADVSLRGMIVAPNKLTSGNRTIEELTTMADLAIAEQLLGKITVQTRLNPMITIGDFVTFDGSEMNVSGLGIITRITHSYSVGNASTSLKLRVTE